MRYISERDVSELETGESVESCSGNGEVSTFEVMVLVQILIQTSVKTSHKQRMASRLICSKQGREERARG